MKLFPYNKILRIQALVIGILCCFHVGCDNLKQPDFDRGTTAGLDNNFLLTYSLFFIVPDLDFNQFCPPTNQIPILEPGTYTRFMKAGDTFIFDNRARLNAGTPNTGTGNSEYFTFTIQENPGQNIILTSPECGNSPLEFKSKQDSGLTGQLENIYVELTIPPLPARRSSFFTKLTATTGSGTITFTTPFTKDPPH